MQKLKSLSKTQLLAILLILVGAAIMIPRALGMLDFYREVQYAMRNNFQEGNPSPDLLRPWMSLRYVAQAYAVPQKYLFDAAGIQPRKETSFVAIYRLNRQMNLGLVDNRPALLATIRQAIIDYRANPVATGLVEQHVEGWMTLQYVANSTGVPVERFLEALALPPRDNNAYLVLEFMAEELNYPGGPRGLVQDVQAVVDRLAPANPALPPASTRDAPASRQGVKPQVEAFLSQVVDP